MSVIFYEAPHQEIRIRYTLDKAELTEDQKAELRGGDVWKQAIGLAENELRSALLGHTPYVPQNLLELHSILCLTPEWVPVDTLRQTILRLFEGQDRNGAWNTIQPGGGKPAGDEESLLTLLVCRHVRVSGDEALLSEMVGGSTVLTRLLLAMEHLFTARWDERFGLILNLPLKDKLSAGLHVNALASLAIRELLEMPGVRTDLRRVWVGRLVDLGIAIRASLWDKDLQRHYPRRVSDEGLIALAEDCIYPYANALALQAGFLSETEKAATLRELLAAVRANQGRSVGFSHLPPAPDTPDAILSPHAQPREWLAQGAWIAAAHALAGFHPEAMSMLRPIADLALAAGRFAESVDPADPTRASDFSPAAAAAFLYTVQLLNAAPSRLTARPRSPSKPAHSTAKSSADSGGERSALRVSAQKGPCPFAAILRVKGGIGTREEFACLIRDISSTRVELELPLPVSEGAVVELATHLNTANQATPCELRGEVRWLRAQKDDRRFHAAVELTTRGANLKAWQRYLQQKGIA